MKLNKECVRSIMLFCENNLTIENCLRLNDFISSNELDYSDDDIKYTLEKLNETPYLNMEVAPGSADRLILVYSITWQGHQFLDTIRDSHVWATTKKIAGKLESVSITVLSNIATGVINHLIDKAMSKNSFWQNLEDAF